MVKIQINEYTELDKVYIDQLRDAGVPDDIIQIGYDSLQRRRREERKGGKDKKQSDN